MKSQPKQRLDSISPSISTNDEVILEETCGFQIGCGPLKCKRLPTSFLQCFATSRWALLFFSIGAVVQGFIVNGHAPSIISTLERRFELTSTESGLISSCYDMAGSVVVLFVTYVGGRGHKPLWIGWGMFLIGISGIVFSLPHFLAPHYTFTDTMNVCENATLDTCEISDLKNYRFVFYASFLLAGMGAAPLYSLTITYLDENVKLRYSSMYNGIFLATSVVGPGIGFLVGGAFLQQYTYFNEIVSITPSSEQWVGAWWIGFLIIGIIGILSSIPALLLPRVIPGTEKHRKGREEEIHQAVKAAGTDENFGKNFRDFPKCLFTLLRNPTFCFLTFGVAIDSLLVGGMATFGAKYLQTQFGLSASDAGIYFGLLAILGGAVGQVTAAGIISKFDLGVKWMLHASYIAPFLAALCSMSYLITCSNTMIAGVTVPYHDSNSASSLSSICNSGCGCSEGVYRPVCGSDGITYFSPCFAGCSQKLNGEYFNCTCIAAATSGPPYNVTAQTTATIGTCIDDACSTGWEIILFCLLNFFLMFLTFFNESPALQVSLRCVGFNQRSFAIGIQTLVTRILGTVPGPLIVGALFDQACSRWTEECGTRGSCLSYSNSALSLNIFLFIGVVKVVDGFLYLAAMLCYKPVQETLTSESSSVSDDKSNGSESVGVTVSYIKDKPTNVPENNGAVKIDVTLPGETLPPALGEYKESFTNPIFTPDEVESNK